MTCLPTRSGGTIGQCRRPALHGDRHELVRAVRDPVAVEAQHLRCVLHRPEDRPRHDVGTHGTQPELEVGDDAEVPATASHTPEQVGVLVLAGLHELSVGGDHVHRLQLVDREPVLAHDPPDATAERQARHAGVGDDARGNREPELLGLAVELAEQHACLHPHRSRLGVHPDALHRPQVDDQAVVAHGQTGEAVASPAHRHQQVAPARETHGCADVGDTGAPGDEAGAAVDRAVPHLAVLVVAGVSRTDELTAHRRLQLVERTCLEQRSLGQ